MNIIKRHIDDLVPAEYNPRVDLKPGDKEYDKLKRSIEEFGYVEPIIYNKRNNTVVGGHQRLKVLKDLGYTDIDVVEVDLNENDEKALNIALNKVSGDWDNEKLAELLNDLQMDNYDVDLTGFDSDEINSLLDSMINDIEDDITENDDNGTEIKRKDYKNNLINKFGGFAPFSVLNAASGDWLNRKREWLNLGIRSEVGREAAVINKGGGLEKYDGVQSKYVNYTSIFDPVLCEIMYRWFNIQGGSIFDPFAGGSVRGIVADTLGYKYTGIELRQEQVDANKDNADEIGCCPIWICDDSRNMDRHIDDNSFDMIFTCPPYADLEVYSKDDRDISNKKYDEFISLYKDILIKASKKLKDNRFFVIVVGEVRDKHNKLGAYYNFVGDTINILKNKCGLNYYNEAILVTPTGSMAITCGNAMNKKRKVGKKHQNILIFYKGNGNIHDYFGDVLSKEDLDMIESQYDGGDTDGRTEA